MSDRFLFNPARNFSDKAFIAGRIFASLTDGECVPMATIELSELDPGMVLATDLRAPNGRFLLGKGAHVTSDHLEVMAAWGVVEVDVEGLSDQELESKRSAHIDPSRMQAAEEKTRQRFAHANLDHEGMGQLFQTSVLIEAQQLTDGTAETGNNDSDSPDDHMDCPRLPESAERKVEPGSLIRDKLKLPSLPVIFDQINDALNDPRSSATYLAGIISKDASLSALLLKLVNSAFYGFPSRIDTISRAIAIIGTKELSTLALGACALKMFRDIPRELMDMKSFWKHSIACGILARILGSYKQSNASTERLFLAGLLHDIGRLPMFQSLPLQAKAALVSARRTGRLLCDAEQEVFGFDHAMVGGMLVKKWKFPLIFERSVSAHHTCTTGNMAWETALVHVSDVVANALAVGSSGEQFVPPLAIKAWHTAGLSVGILKAAIRQAQPYIEETIQVFFPNG